MQPLMHHDKPGFQRDIISIHASVYDDFRHYIVGWGGFEVIR